MKKTIMKILEEGSLDQIKELSDNPIKFKNGWGFLHYIVGNKDPECVIYLFDKMSNEFDKISKKCTNPLHCAAYYGNLSSIHLSLQYKIDPYLKDNDSCTFIDILRRRHFSSLIPIAEKMILAHQNDTEACNYLANFYYERSIKQPKNNEDFALFYINKGLLNNGLKEDQINLLKKLKSNIIHRKTESEANNIVLKNPENAQNNQKLSYLSDFWKTVTTKFTKNFPEKTDENHALLNMNNNR